ncbi:MAG: MBL fold metallo-hydrolase [Candidatus Micrarchaeaceae archaeon]
MSISIGMHRIALDGIGCNPNLNFISHAHSDHIRRPDLEAVMSKETEELIKVVYGKNVKRADAGNTRLLDAGHILGSKQLFIDDCEHGYSIVYTGDYQLEPSFAAKPIEMREADIAIIDSTYPYPSVKFDDKLQVAESIQKYALEVLDKGIAIFGAYALGKAQELIKILNDAGMVPVVSKKISAINKIYERNSIALEYISAYDDYDEFDSAIRRNFVAVIESHDLGGIKAALKRLYSKAVYTAVATGFAKIYRFNTDAQFALSDHADFRQATSYIDSVNPSIIFTFGGNAELFASNLRNIGYNAAPYNGLDLVEPITESATNAEMRSPPNDLRCKNAWEGKNFLFGK